MDAATRERAVSLEEATDPGGFRYDLAHVPIYYETEGEVIRDDDLRAIDITPTQRRLWVYGHQLREGYAVRFYPHNDGRTDLPEPHFLRDT